MQDLTPITHSNFPANLNDRMAALKQRATSSSGEIWQPKTGECLVGAIVVTNGVKMTP